MKNQDSPWRQYPKPDRPGSIYVPPLTAQRSWWLDVDREHWSDVVSGEVPRMQRSRIVTQIYKGLDT